LKGRYLRIETMIWVVRRKIAGALKLARGRGVAGLSNEKELLKYTKEEAERKKKESK